MSREDLDPSSEIDDHSVPLRRERSSRGAAPLQYIACAKMASSRFSPTRSEPRATRMPSHAARPSGLRMCNSTVVEQLEEIVRRAMVLEAEAEAEAEVEAEAEAEAEADGGRGGGGGRG